MSGGKSTALSNNVLTWALVPGATAPTRPTSLQVSLYTDNTGLTSAPSTEAVNASGNCLGYSRQNVSFGSVSASGGSISNTVDVAFTATGGPWLTVNYYGILDNTGSMLYWSPLSTSRQLQVSGDKLDFAIGSISVSEK